MLRRALFFLIVVLVTQSAFATLTSVRSGDWNDPGTWDANRTPGANEDVRIAAGHTVTIQPGMVDPTTFLATDVDRGTAATYVDGTLAWPSMAGATFTASAPIQISAGGTFSISGVAQHDLRASIVNDGSVVWQSTLLSLSPGLSFTNRGSFQIQSADTLHAWNFPQVAFANEAGGTIVKDSDGTTVIDGTLQNAGAIQVNRGVLQIGGSLTTSGAVSVASIAQLTISSTTAINAGAQFSQAGLVYFTGDVSVAATNTSIPNAYLPYGMTMTITGSYRVRNGELLTVAGGHLVTPGASAFNIDAGGTMDVVTNTLLIGGGITNAGLFRYRSQNGPLDFEPAMSFVNAAGGVFQIETAQALRNPLGGTPTFTNEGTIRKTAAGETRWGIALTSSGTIDMQAGQMHMNAATISGAVNLGGALIGGPFIVDAGASFSGGDWLWLENTSITINATNLAVPHLYLAGNGAGVTLNGSYRVRNGDVLYVDGGYIDTPAGANAFTIESGGLVNIVSSGSLHGQINVAGTFRHAGTGSFVLANATMPPVIDVSAGGILSLESSGTISGWYGAGTVHIASGGTLRKTGSATSGIEIASPNDGTIDVQDGLLILHSYTAGAGSTLQFDLSSATSYGHLQFDQSVDFAGSIAVALSGGYTPAGGESFTLMSYWARAGDFSSRSYPAAVSWQEFLNSNDFVLTAGAPGADIAIAKSAPATVNAGDAFAYTIDVNNTSSVIANSVTVIDTLPAGVAYVSTSASSPWTCSGTTTVTCTATTLVPGAAPAITINVTAPSSATTVTNLANVSSAADSNAANNASSAATTVNLPPQADVAVTVSGPPSASGTFSFVVSVTNAGPASATNVVANLTLPAGVTPAGTNACSAQCMVGTLAGGASAQMTLSFTPNTTGSKTLSATVSATEPDPNSTNNAASATTNVSCAPIAVAITGPTAFCAGGSATLDAGSGFASYLWSTGATTQSITVSAAGTYSVTVTNANGCSASASRAVTVNSQPIVTIAGASSTCAGAPVTLDAGAGFASYAWSNGATSQSITLSLNATATVSVTVTDTAGCSATASKTVTVSTATVPTITADGATTFCVGGSTVLRATSASSYQWFKDGSPIAGATAQSITVDAAGSYSVRVIEPNGCAASSQPVTVTTLGESTAALQAPDVVNAGDEAHAIVTGVPATATLSWSVEGGSIVAGQGTTDLTLRAEALGVMTVTLSIQPVGGCPTTLTRAIEVRRPESDLAVVLSAAVPFVQGSNIDATYSIVNYGPSAAPNTVITINVPPGMSVQSTDCAKQNGANGDELLLCTVGTLERSAPVAGHFTVVAGSAGLFAIRASIASNNADPATANNESAVTLDVPAAANADLGVKLSAPSRVAASSQIPYTITVSNSGPSASNSIVLVTLAFSQPLAAMDLGPWCSPTANGAACSFPALQPNESSSRTIVMKALPAGTTIDAVASVQSSAGDANPANDTSMATTIIESSCAEAPSIAQPVNGAILVGRVTFQWSLVSAATGYLIEIDQNGRAYQVLNPGMGATASVTLPSGTYGWRVVAYAACGEAASQRSTFTVAAPPAVADLQVIATTTPSAPAAYEPVQFHFTIRNNGPDRATETQLIVKRPILLGTSHGPARELNELPSTFTVSGGRCHSQVVTITTAVNRSTVITEHEQIVCDIDALNNGQSIDVIVNRYALPLAAMEPMTALVAGEEIDPLATNNSVTLPQIAGRGSVADEYERLDIRDDRDPVNPGTIFQYIVHYTNLGNGLDGDRKRRTLSLSLPASVEFVEADRDGAPCSLSTTGVVFCDVAFGVAPPFIDEQRTFTVRARRDASGNLNVTASVFSADPNSPSKLVSETTAVKPFVRGADLRLGVTSEPGAPVAFEPVQYHFTISNEGPAEASGTRLIIRRPIASDLSTHQLMATKSAATTSAGQCHSEFVTVTTAVHRTEVSTEYELIVCEISDTLSKPVEVTVSRYALPIASMEPITATVVSEIGDPLPSNNTVTTPQSMSTGAVVPFERLNIHGDRDSVAPGSIFRYVVDYVVYGNGAGGRRLRTMDFRVPPGTEFIEAETQGDPCALNDDIVSCKVADGVAPDFLQRRYAFTMRALPAAGGTIQASVRSWSVDPNAPTSVATTTTVIRSTAIADLRLDVTSEPSAPVVYEPVKYRFTVRNMGPERATDTHLVIRRPLLMTAGASSGEPTAVEQPSAVTVTAGRCETKDVTVTTAVHRTVAATRYEQIVCELDALSSGQSVEVTVSHYALPIALDPINAFVAAEQGDPVASNNSVTTVQKSANGSNADAYERLSITDDRDPVAAGSIFHYVVDYHRYAGDTPRFRTLALSLPAGAEFVEADQKGCTWTTLNVVLCEGIIGRFVDRRWTFTVRALPQSSGPLQTTASVFAGDPNAPSKVVTESTTVIGASPTPKVNVD